jgi:hypothetical protein
MHMHVHICMHTNAYIDSYIFILVGCILLLYLYMLYKHTTQKKNHTYVIRKRNLTISLLFQKFFTTCFGPYGLSSGDIFEDFLLYCILKTSLALYTYRLRSNR